MRLVFMGTPGFAVPSLERLMIEHQVVAVYTRRDKPTGRGLSTVPSPVKKAALDHGLPVMHPDSLKAAEAQVADLHPDAIVVAAYGQILPQVILTLPEYGCINIHPSLLPRFRGASPVASAILEGDDFTGVSIMLMDAGMDTGPILANKQTPISPEDTTGSLTTRLSLMAAGLLQEVLERWPKGEITPRPQNAAEATYCRPITKEEGEINWRLPAMDIWRRVRAYNPWPGSYTEWTGKRLKIIEAVPLLGMTIEAGRVIAVNEDGARFGIGTGDGILGVVKLQLEGKRAVAAAEFVRGQRGFIGAVLPG